MSDRPTITATWTENDVGVIKSNEAFKNAHLSVRLDMLKDVIYDLEKLYDDTLEEMDGGAGGTPPAPSTTNPAAA